MALEIGREVGIDLATTGDLNNLRGIPLHGLTSQCIATIIDLEWAQQSMQIDFS